MAKAAPVVLYSRVSNRERAEKGYSVDGQFHDLREYALRERFEVVEEISDKGYSRDNLLRPGLMRVRELAAEYHGRGEKLTVWAWKRDRYGEAPYPEILALELEPYGVKLCALDDSGEGDDAEDLLPRALVDEARRRLARPRWPETSREKKAREWGLGGFLHCSCGGSMCVIVRRARANTYAYYRCNSTSVAARFECRQPMLRADKAEPAVWEAVSSLLTDPAVRARLSARALSSEAKASAQKPPVSAIAEARRRDANAQFDAARAGSREAAREAERLEQALRKLEGLEREDLARFGPDKRRKLYEATDLTAVASGKSVKPRVSGVFCLEGSTYTPATGSSTWTGA